MDDFIGALQLQAQHYREAYKLEAQAPLELDVPIAWVDQLLATYGSLRWAADAIFDPGTVTITCREWHDLQYKINMMFQLAPPPWRCIDPNDLMRIAVTCG